MKKSTLCFALFGLLTALVPALGEICTIDDVPAATLLLPYFEVDLDDRNGTETMFSINNASASAAVAHVTLWTDESIPTLDFDIYLTGYDVQTINLHDVFNGILPRTADDGADPTDTISPQGANPPGPQDINFPGATGPCGSAATLYAAPPTPTLTPALIDHIRKSHTGRFSSIYGGCLGLDYGDNIARGYLTIDSVTTCNLQFPSSTGYFTGIADNRNILWGDYFYADQNEDFAQGETLVHIEACPNPSVGQGADDCPFVPGEYTFYGRYVGGTAIDQREPLATNFATRYINGGAFTSGTDLIVWRDSKIPLGAVIPTHDCPGNFAQFPLNQADVVAFDEVENPTNLCFQGSNVSPPTGGTQTCFPVEAQRVNLQHSLVPLGATPAPPSPFGWMFLNLNTTVAGQTPGLPAAVAQAWVTTVINAAGRFGVGYDAIKLDTACDNLTGGLILVP